MRAERHDARGPAPSAVRVPWRCAFALRAACFGLLLAAGPALAADDAQATRFRLSDANGDGFVDRAEHDAAMRREFGQQDLDHDGFVTLPEYQRWLEHNVAGAQGRRVALPAAATAAVARCYFRMVDSSGDGKLSLDEHLGYTARVFKALDRDGDGRLTLAESKGQPDPKVMGPLPVCH